MSKYIIGNTSSLPEISSSSSESFLSILFNKPWKIAIYIAVVILIINIIIFVLRRYTKLLDYPIFDKVFSALPWLRGRQ